MSAWTDRFVGDRMAVDREFTQRVAASEFSSQEWGTIMTAVEFDIENPESPEEARIVADTSKIDQILPALEQMGDAMGMGGGGASGGGAGGRGSAGGSGDRGDRSGGEGSGLFGSIKDSLGLGDGGDGTEQRAESAAALADEYAMQFQEHLEGQGKWEEACEVAATLGDAPRGEHAEESPDE